MHLVAARCTGPEKSPSSPHAHCLSRHLSLVKNTARISLSGAIHCVMNSYFMEFFGRRCRDKVPMRSQVILSMVRVVRQRWGYPSKRQNNKGVFPFFFSLTQSLSHSVHHLSVSMSVFFFHFSLTHFPLSLCLSLPFFTATKDLSKQNSWTNRPWDEFHGGSWQQQTEGRGACQHLHWVVKIWYSHSDSNRVDMLKSSRPCFSGDVSRETTRCSHPSL